MGRCLFLALPCAAVLFTLEGCSTTGWIVGGTITGTAIAARSPGHEIEQVYYLGVFDPREQVPSTIYRVTVRGQAASISGMKFGSGWVQADLIDTLNSRVGFDPDKENVTITRGEGEPMPTLQTGRRLMLFGPEGFREAPKDHRLVIVMGANPDAFFNAIDQSLSAITDVRKEQSNSELGNKLFKVMQAMRNEDTALASLSKDVATDMPASSASTAKEQKP